MSVWVITPRGNVIAYPSVSKIIPQTDGSIWLRTHEDRFVGIAPHGSVVSYVEPGAVRVNAAATVPTIAAAVELLNLCVDRLTEYRFRRPLSDLKRTLGRFDARTGAWRDAE